MQDPATFQQVKPHFPEQEQLKCPRCDSTNTKFCYYNNYNLSQPRHFCKNCRRYWTKGGALRNIPVGGGSRKNTKRSSNPKRPSPSSSSSTTTTQSISSISSMPNCSLSSNSSVFPKTEQTGVVFAVDQDRRMLDMTGSFSSLLNSNAQFGNLLEGFNPNDDPTLRTIQFGEFATEHSSSSSLENLAMDLQSGGNQDGLLSIQGGDSGCWGGGSSNGGWPDLAIHTPGSAFQ